MRATRLQDAGAPSRRRQEHLTRDPRVGTRPPAHSTICGQDMPAFPGGRT
jgi:hypothetical protein